MKARLVLLSLAMSLLLAACGQEPEKVKLNYSPEDIQALQLRTFESIWTTVNDNYVYSDFNGVNWAEIREEYESRLDEPMNSVEFTAMMEEMLSELPAGTAQLQSREARIEAAAGNTLGYEGIGAFVTLREEPEPRLVLMEVMPESPGQQAGLQAHDAILAIDGNPVEADSVASQIARVRGEAGSKLSLTVRTPGQEPREVELTRRQIEAIDARLVWHPLGDSGIGYVRFPPADYEELLQDFVLALQTFDSTGDLDGLILDLRITTAGEAWPVAPLLTLFADGVVGEVYSREESNPVSVTGVFDFVNSHEVPLVVLVGPNTTGPAEIFAAALQASDEAVVIGLDTTGDVETLAPFFMPDGSRAFVAIFAFRTRDGREIGLDGLRPDVPVQLDWDEVTDEQDQVIGVALELLESNLAE
jgi:carboxyl-terminal processing protease